MLKFEYLKREDMPKYIDRIFFIIHTNISAKFPQGSSVSDAYNTYCNSRYENTKKDYWYMVLIWYDDEIVGFFEYFIKDKTLRMGEIQLLSDFREKYGIFKKLYQFVVPNIPQDTKYIWAYADKRNLKSQGILNYLGLTIESETQKGFNFTGDYSKLVSWCNS